MPAQPQEEGTGKEEGNTPAQKLEAPSGASTKPKSATDNLKSDKDRDPLAGYGKKTQTGKTEASIDDFFASIGQERTYKKEIAGLGRVIELQCLSNKAMKSIYEAAKNPDKDRNEVEFNYLVAWESWVPSDRGVYQDDKTFLPIKSYAVFCQIPWQIVNAIALEALSWSLGGFTEEDIKKKVED